MFFLLNVKNYLLYPVYHVHKKLFQIFLITFFGVLN